MTSGTKRRLVDTMLYLDGITRIVVRYPVTGKANPPFGVIAHFDADPPGFRQPGGSFYSRI